MTKNSLEKIRELTIMLMYLTSWKERDTPGLHAVKKKELEKYPFVRRCWKGYTFGVLEKLSEEGLISISSPRQAYPARITSEGEAEARRLLKQYGIDIDTEEN